MTDNTGSKVTRETPRRRWPTMLLAVSLTLNLLVLGLIAGAYFRDERDTRRFPPPDRDVMRSTGFGPFFDAMPREARNRLGDALRGQEQRFRPDRTALVSEFNNMLSTLRAEPFSPEALEGLMVAQQERANERTAAGRTVLIEQIASMSPAERGKFADELEERFSHVLRRGPMSGDDGPRTPRND